MAGFVGWMVHDAGIRFPSRARTASPRASAAGVWTIPFLAKLQIIGMVGVFEHISEDKNFLAADGMTHYMRGGKPGYMPTFKANVHPSPFNLWDPFGFTKGLSAEQKAKKLNAEVNNGRLAMIGLFSLISAACVPGSVPAFDGIVATYSGDVMAPFRRRPDASFWTVGKMWWPRARAVRIHHPGGPPPRLPSREEARAGRTR